VSGFIGNSEGRKKPGYLFGDFALQSLLVFLCFHFKTGKGKGIICKFTLAVSRRLAKIKVPRKI
jgi:hypothetical protein